MDWWIWALFGLLLVFIEAATPGGFYAAFFAVGAFIIATLVGLGVGGPLWWQWLLFSVNALRPEIPIKSR